MSSPADAGQRADDAARAAILKAHGGLYLDNDCDCLGPVDASLSVASLVLQVHAHSVRCSCEPQALLLNSEA